MFHLDTSEHHDIDIFIFSVSQAPLRALDSCTTNSKTISECRKSLNKVATHLKINLIWVPGHQSIEGNCIEDKDTVGIPMATGKLHLRHRLYTLSKNQWNTISTSHNSRVIWLK